MAFTKIESARIEGTVSDFLERRRPPEKIRSQVDITFRLEGQSVVILELRPFWRDTSRIIEGPVAKATYVRRMKRWKIFWQRADLKWHAYEPHPEALLFEEFLAVVDDDENGCFWG